MKRTMNASSLRCSAASFALQENLSPFNIKTSCACSWHDSPFAFFTLLSMLSEVNSVLMSSARLLGLDGLKTDREDRQISRSGAAMRASAVQRGMVCLWRMMSLAASGRLSRGLWVRWLTDTRLGGDGRKQGFFLASSYDERTDLGRL